MTRRMIACLGATVLALGLAASPVAAQSRAEMEFSVSVAADGTVVQFKPDGLPTGSRGMTLNITGPNEYQASAFFDNEMPRIDLREFGRVDDGVFKYQITGATPERYEPATKLNNGRDDLGGGVKRRSFSVSGQIMFKDGKMVVFKDIKEGDE